MLDLKLSWRVFLDTSEKPTAEKITKNIFAILGESSCTLRACKIYWKRPNSHELTFDQLIQADNFEKMVVEILHKFSLLSPRWNINLEADFNEQSLRDLMGDSVEDFRIEGVLAMNFLIETEGEDFVFDAPGDDDDDDAFYDDDEEDDDDDFYADDEDDEDDEDKLN